MERLKSFWNSINSAVNYGAGMLFGIFISFLFAVVVYKNCLNLSNYNRIIITAPAFNLNSVPVNFLEKNGYSGELTIQLENGSVITITPPYRIDRP